VAALLRQEERFLDECGELCGGGASEGSGGSERAEGEGGEVGS
jgi:hypothetical protein